MANALDADQAAWVRALAGHIVWCFWSRHFTLSSSFHPGARFSKAPETFRARKTIFSSSASKIGEVYAPETSCMKNTVNKSAL